MNLKPAAPINYGFMPRPWRRRSWATENTAVGKPFAGEDISRRLHLHAKNLRIPHPAGGILEVSAPLPDHMRATFRTFGFDDRAGKGLFQEFKDLEEP